jgi:hypothetical protein
MQSKDDRVGTALERVDICLTKANKKRYNVADWECLAPAIFENLAVSNQPSAN